jgi:hypothetical protein
VWFCVDFFVRPSTTIRIFLLLLQEASGKKVILLHYFWAIFSRGGGYGGGKGHFHVVFFNFTLR